MVTRTRFGSYWGFHCDELVKATIVHIWFCDCGLDIVFSRKHKANLPGGFTSLRKAVMLSVVVSTNIHEHILKPCQSRNKTRKTASRG